MNVMFCDKFVDETTIELDLAFDKKINFNLKSSEMSDLLKESDFISFTCTSSKKLCYRKKGI